MENSEILSFLPQALKNLVDQVAFVHFVIDQVCGKPTSQNIDDFKREKVTIKDLLRLSAAFQSFYSYIAFQRLNNKENILKLLTSVNLLGDIANEVTSAYLARYDEIFTALTEKTAHISNATLLDFDWKVNSILASDKIANISEPILQLRLDIKQEDGSIAPKTFELNRQQLNDLIAEMEKAKKALQTLTV